MANMMGVTKHKCEQCGMYFRDGPKLSRHIKEVHENISFECNVCGKKFTRKESMNAHRRTFHEKSEDFKCHICGKLHTCMRQLRRHVR